MIKRLLTHKLTHLMIAGLLLTTAFITIPSITAFAQENEPSHGVDERLENGLARLQTANGRLQERLAKTSEIVIKGEEWIANLQAEGMDTAVLENALATYQTEVAAAQALADSAAQILTDHAGFDDEGNVTDRQTAVATLRDAGRTLRDSHRTLRDATITLRRTAQDFRRDHRGEQSS